MFMPMLPSKADNIKDFQIEGISIGDSLLDYFSLSQLKELANHRSAFSYKNSSAKSLGLIETYL